MKCIYIIAVCLIYFSNADDTVIVEETNVLDPNFEKYAIEAYKEAHQMVPTDNPLFYQTLSYLFGSKQRQTRSNWKISSDCKGFYNPDTKGSYIILYVKDSAGERHIRIFA